MVLHSFQGQLARVESTDWQQPPGVGKWSPATLAVHVCRSYELGRDAMSGAPSMQLQVPPLRAWLSRTLLLPLLLVTRRFPRGAEAPAEVIPDAAEARGLTPTAAALRLERAAEGAVTALRRAAREPAPPPVTHAYFGPLRPYVALRLLSAHTRHHTLGLTRLAKHRRVG